MQVHDEKLKETYQLSVQYYRDVFFLRRGATSNDDYLVTSCELRLRQNSELRGVPKGSPAPNWRASPNRTGGEYTS